MSARITPLRLEGFEQLPKHARRCVFWEVDPATLGDQDHLADPEFEKEAWFSMVMLEWGSCGQIATPVAAEHSDAEPTCIGYVLYAPPRAVPRAQRFPTAPVSADAVLLTSMGIEPGQGADDLPHQLIAGVIDELVRRGVRALEAFGRTRAAAELQDPQTVDADVRPVLEALGDCSVEHCVIDADFLKDAGFVVVAPHRYFPRLRLELDKDLGWKAEVEAALERLLASAQLQQPVGAGATITNAVRGGESGQEPPSRLARSTANSCASNSAKVNVPVGRSFLPSR
ncbi:acetyltransferase [Mycobacterium helveticum]|uniref:Acetyltransferase n=1 Tax=Mycobacterium helveticum TaxID=2592811 RepID=A0A557XPK1_9MYCO|nr:acetyltransferase [Mycobacterium helveticum]TVS87805.1 acetyltransferase [Mycobacterium helveticum]